MLQIRSLSGEIVAVEELQEQAEELSDVRSLKRRLNQFHGMATRFRQRFLLHGEILEDTAKLELSVDLTLVLLPQTDIS